MKRTIAKTPTYLTRTWSVPPEPPLLMSHMASLIFGCPRHMKFFAVPDVPPFASQKVLRAPLVWPPPSPGSALSQVPGPMSILEHPEMEVLYELLPFQGLFTSTASILPGVSTLDWLASNLIESAG